MRTSLLLLFGFPVAVMAAGGRLEELCLGDGGSVLPDLSLADLDLRFQMDHQDVLAMQNLTESALYPLHVVGGDYEEAMIRIHAPEQDFLVNLEPGHAGVECRTMNKGNHDATIWFSMEPSASYAQLLSLGTVTFDVWVGVNSSHLGYDRYTFDVVADEEEVALVAAFRETKDGVEDSVVLSLENTTTPSPSTANETVVSDSVVLQVTNTPTVSPTSVFVTFPPTSTSSPTTTMSPTYTEPCHLCGDATARVTNLEALTSIMGLQVACGVLQSWANDNLLSENTCSVALETVAENCDCKPMDDTPTPSSLLTLPPTSTMLPTITSSPTYTVKCSFDTEAHCFDGDASMNILGLAYPCKAIVEQGGKGLLSPNTCTVAQEAFERGDCACTPTSFPTTRLPSVSPVPTVTALPTYTEPCVICAGDDAQSVEVFNQTISCGELRMFGQSSLIDPSVCSEAQRIAGLACNCPVTAAEGPTSSPLSSSNVTGSETGSPAASGRTVSAASYIGAKAFLSTGLLALLIFVLDL